MAIYHCSIKIISRAGGRSAVASAAYRSGEKLYNEETGLTHDFTNKGGVIMSEIILPENAPSDYQNRELLWNEVQKVESRSDARFAREVEVALPVEMNREQQIECVRNYIQENFTSKGMIADWALHDKEDGNPHAHIMLTTRALNENHEWDTKTRSVFANARDEEGRAIYNPELPSYDPKDRENTSHYRIPQLDENGEQKFRERAGKGKEMLWERVNIPSNDWNDRANAEKWRESWAEHCNRYLDPEHQIDHRSYERQGIDKEPTIHEGFTARKIEADGNISERVQINREIKDRNSFREEMKQLARELTQAITEKARAIYERFAEFIRHSGHSEQARGDADHSGGSAGGYRKPDEREGELERTDRRIDELKRDAGEAERELQRSLSEIQQTDRDIEATNQRIIELQQLTLRKERERDERLKKLRERRDNRRIDGDVRESGERDRQLEGGNREAPTAERKGLRSTTDDIRSFLASVDAEEQNIGDSVKTSIRDSRNAEELSIAVAEQRGLEEQERLAEQAARKALKPNRGGLEI